MALTKERPSKADKTRDTIMKDLQGDSTKRLNAEVEATLYRRIKMRSAEEGRSISEITRELWVEYLSK